MKRKRKTQRNGGILGNLDPLLRNRRKSRKRTKNSRKRESSVLTNLSRKQPVFETSESVLVNLSNKDNRKHSMKNKIAIQREKMIKNVDSVSVFENLSHCTIDISSKEEYPERENVQKRKEDSSFSILANSAMNQDPVNHCVRRNKCENYESNARVGRKTLFERKKPVSSARKQESCLFGESCLLGESCLSGEVSTASTNVNNMKHLDTIISTETKIRITAKTKPKRKPKPKTKPGKGITTKMKTETTIEKVSNSKDNITCDTVETDSFKSPDLIVVRCLRERKNRNKTRNNTRKIMDFTCKTPNLSKKEVEEHSISQKEKVELDGSNCNECLLESNTGYTLNVEKCQSRSPPKKDYAHLNNKILRQAIIENFKLVSDTINTKDVLKTRKYSSKFPLRKTSARPLHEESRKNFAKHFTSSQSASNRYDNEYMVHRDQSRIPPSKEFSCLKSETSRKVVIEKLTNSKLTVDRKKLVPSKKQALSVSCLQDFKECISSQADKKSERKVSEPVLGKGMFSSTLVEGQEGRYIPYSRNSKGKFEGKGILDPNFDGVKINFPEDIVDSDKTLLTEGGMSGGYSVISPTSKYFLSRAEKEFQTEGLEAQNDFSKEETKSTSISQGPSSSVIEVQYFKPFKILEDERPSEISSFRKEEMRGKRNEMKSIVINEDFPSSRVIDVDYFPPRSGVPENSECTLHSYKCYGNLLSKDDTGSSDAVKVDGIMNPVLTGKQLSEATSSGCQRRSSRRRIPTNRYIPPIEKVSRHKICIKSEDETYPKPACGGEGTNSNQQKSTITERIPCETGVRMKDKAIKPSEIDVIALSEKQRQRIPIDQYPLPTKMKSCIRHCNKVREETLSITENEKKEINSYRSISPPSKNNSAEAYTKAKCNRIKSSKSDMITFVKKQAVTNKNALATKSRADSRKISITKQRRIQRIKDQGKNAPSINFSKVSKEWTEDQSTQLKNAYISVDPCSNQFWQEVSRYVDCKNEEECAQKWFNMIGSPTNKNKDKIVDRKSAKFPYQEGERMFEDDLFNATPMKSQLSVQRADTTENALFNDVLTSPIIDEEEPKGCIINDYDYDKENAPLISRAGYKCYIRNLRRDISRAEKKVKKMKYNVKQVRTSTLSDRIGHGSLEVDGCLTPGGTLRVRTIDLNQEEYDYFGSDIEDE